MNRLWRISNHHDLQGLGGEWADGRWHTAARGKRIVYLSEHPALALVEALVNLKGNPLLFPDQYQMLGVDAPPEVPAEDLDRGSLPAGWEQDLQATRNLGDAWLESGRSALLSVPSAAAPESVNYLLNPAHPAAAALSISWSRWIKYDQRLFRARPGSWPQK